MSYVENPNIHNDMNKRLWRWHHAFNAVRYTQ